MLNFREKDFERVLINNISQMEMVSDTRTFWQDATYRFKKNKGAFVGICIIALILIMALIGPYFNEYTYDQVMKERTKLPPRVPVLENLGIMDGTLNGVNIYEEKGLDDVYHYFGTDKLGRDLWTRVWIGTRVSFYIAFLAMMIDMVIGITYGMISGYMGGRVDVIMQRIIEIIVGIPSLVIITLLVLVLNPGIMSISLALIITGWIGMSRVVRSQVLKLKEMEFILASKTLNSSTPRIIFKDILPNIFGQVIVMSMFSVPNAIFYESFLAFIGLGLQPPMASLGVLISDGYKSILVYPYMVVFPVAVIALLMLTFNLVADGLRDAFDPKMKEE